MQSSSLPATDLMRWSLNRHMPAVVWISGLPASGKTSLATALELRLLNMGFHAIALDESLIDARLSQSSAHRAMLDKAALLFHAGQVVVISMISPTRKERILSRSFFPKMLFYEVYLDAPELVCAERDLHHRYSNKGEIIVSSRQACPIRYEPHRNAEMSLDVVGLSVRECVEELVVMLTDGGCLDRREMQRSTEELELPP